MNKKKLIRDITSAKLTGNLIEFKTRMTPFLSQIEEGLSLSYIKKEILEFKCEDDANLYFYNVLQELDGVPDIKDIPKPHAWLKANKFKISDGETYHDPKITMRQCASWIGEYVKEFFN